MLTEPIVVYPSASDQSNSHSLSRIDTDNGRSVYQVKGGGETYTLTIGSTVTKENPSGSDRNLVRLDYETADSLGRSTKASVYLTMVTPRGDGAGNGDTESLLRMLYRFLGGISATPSGVTSATALTNVTTLFGRLYSGET